ncbi:MAG: hypothetical protein Kow00107_00990 [Planctomycetota bacterium]
MEENTTPQQELVSIDEFAKIKLRVAQIVEASEHPKADRLVVMKIRIGEEERQIVAGIKKWYPPETLVGKKIIVVANLQPVVLRGVESQGMLLAASMDDRMGLLTVENDIPSGASIK